MVGCRPSSIISTSGLKLSFTRLSARIVLGMLFGNTGGLAYQAAAKELSLTSDAPANNNEVFCKNFLRKWAVSL
jgi:hypothetical protein